MIQLNTRTIMEKAKLLKEELEIKDCSLSTWWLVRFKDRYGISFKTTCSGQNRK